MKIYSDFAYCYDLFMDDIPYDDWAEYLLKLLSDQKVDKGLVCELGCGTGEMTLRLFDAGYDMIGLDVSEDMLMVARDKMYECAQEDEEINIFYTCQDMRDFELYGTVAAFVSVCDSMNYITDYRDLVKVFKNVNNYLDKQGIFIFDLKTDYFYRHSLGNNSFKQERAEGTLIWNNTYDESTHLNSYDICIDIPDEEDEVYDEISEHHVQRAYSLDEIRQALSEAGMEFIGAKKAFTDEEPDSETERIYVIAREGYQAGKKYEL
jgi:SAM-dependent methyltransferase